MPYPMNSMLASILFASRVKALRALLAASCLLVPTLLPAAQDETLRAGASRIDISPTSPVTMAGYDGRKGLSQGIHDPLSARVIAFSQGGKHLVLVSLDNLGF